MHSEYEIFNYTNINSISDVDVNTFINESKEINYIQWGSDTNKNIDNNIYQKCNSLMSIICYGNDFSIGDFESSVAEIRGRFDYINEKVFGWKLDETITGMQWRSHILIGKNEIKK